jgi:hypothetical protein
MSEPVKNRNPRERKERPTRVKPEGLGTPKQLATIKRIQRDIEQLREQSPELLKQLKL